MEAVKAPQDDGKSQLIADVASGIYAQNVATLKKELPSPSSTAVSVAGNVNNNDSNVLHKRINPFEVEDRMDAYELFKTVLGFLVLIPLRFILLVLFLLFGALFSTIATIGRDVNSKTPMGPFRRCIAYFGLLCIRAILFFVFGVYWIHVKGKRAKRQDAPIIVAAPHRTVMDAFVCSWVCGMPSFVGKKEVAAIPLFGSFTLASDSILVDRKSKDAKKDTLDAIKSRVSSPGYPHLVIFPEGTCTNGKVLINFKRGAFSGDCPVQPIVLRFPFVNFDPSWTAGSNRKYLFLRLLCQFQNSVYVEFLPPYVPNTEELANPNVYAENVRAQMAKNLKVETTEHSYEDMYFAAAARKAGLSPEMTMPYELRELDRLYNIKLDDAIALLKKFRQGHPNAAKDSEVSISVEDFAKLLGLPISEPLTELFGLLDTTGTGRINFTRFVIGISFLSKQTSTDEACKILFLALDREEKGKIPVEKLKKVLAKIFKKPNPKILNSLMHECDPNHTGFVDCETFTKMLKNHPEYLHIALHVTSMGGKGTNELSPQAAKLNLNEKKARAQRDVEISKEISWQPEQRSSLAHGYKTDVEVAVHTGVPITVNP